MKRFGLIILSPRWLVISAIGIIVLIATSPHWSTPYLMDSGDTRMHLFRLFAFDETIRQGVVYPRTLPSLAFGYGYPILNYYPPLGIYIAETLHLFGLTLVNTIKMQFILNTLLAACGAFMMTREFFAEQSGKSIAGILSAIVYVFAPYAIYDAYLRGATTETLAAAILPWVVWAFHLYFKRHSLGALGLVGVFLTLLLFAHSLTLTIAVPFLGAFVLFELACQPAIHRPRVMLGLVSISAIAIGIGALYWLPFVAEWRLVKFGAGENPFASAFNAHLLAPENLIQASLQYQYGSLSSLGLVTASLTALALVMAWRTPMRERAIVLFFGALTFISAGLMLKQTFPIWVAVPFATIIQFPWRVMVLIDLGFSVAIGALPILMTRSNVHGNHALTNLFHLSMTGLVGGAVVYSTLANISPRFIYYPSEEITLAHLARFEGYSGFVGTTSFDEFFPATMHLPAGFNQRLLTPAEYEPSDAQVQLSRYSPTERIFDVSTSAVTSMTLRTFYFPDWQVEIDGIPARAYASTRLGLLTVDVPAGNHRVAFRSVNTPVQILGIGLSIACAIVLLALLGWAVFHRAMESRIILLVLGLTFIVIIFPTFTAVSAPPVTLQSTAISVTSSLKMIGVQIADARWEGNNWRTTGARDRLKLTLYWHVRDGVEEKLLVWRLVEPNGVGWALGEQFPRFGSGFANAWIPNQLVQDQYELALPAGILPGRYELQVSFGDDRHFVPVTMIELPDGSAPAPVPPSIAYPVTALVGDRIRLLGFDAPRVAQSGEEFLVTLYWRADRNVLDDYVVFAQLHNTRGERVAQRDALPGVDLTPTSLWIPSHIVSEPINFQLPRSLKPGIYTLIAGMYGNANQNRLPVVDAAGAPMPDDVIVLGTIRIPMMAQNVQPATTANLTLDSAIRLLGYDLQSSREKVELKLYWQASTKIAEDYNVFLHLVGAQGQVVAQVDQFPGEGLYPTRIWELGEIIIDVYNISLENLPPGKYSLSVGMYMPQTGERLPVGDDSGKELPNRQIPLGSINVTGP